MGIFDKAKEALGDNIEHVDAGIDKAGDFVDDRTGNKYGQQIGQGSEFVKDRLDDRERQAPATPAAPPADAAPATPAQPAPAEGAQPAS